MLIFNEGLMDLIASYWPWLLGIDLVAAAILGIAIALKATEK